MNLDATDEQCVFIGIGGDCDCPLSLKGRQEIGRGGGCARLAGSILGELVESDGVSYADYPAYWRI